MSSHGLVEETIPYSVPDKRPIRTISPFPQRIFSWERQKAGWKCLPWTGFSSWTTSWSRLICVVLIALRYKQLQTYKLPENTNVSYKFLPFPAVMENQNSERVMQARIAQICFVSTFLPIICSLLMLVNIFLLVSSSYPTLLYGTYVIRDCIVL